MSCVYVIVQRSQCHVYMSQYSIQLKFLFKFFFLINIHNSVMVVRSYFQNADTFDCSLLPQTRNSRSQVGSRFMWCLSEES